MGFRLDILFLSSSFCCILSHFLILFFYINLVPLQIFFSCLINLCSLAYVVYFIKIFRLIMSDFLDINSVRFFIVLIFPGLVSMRIYRLLMPARPVDWSNALVEGLFYSIINFALLLPLILFIHKDKFPSEHPILYYICGVVILLAAPILWPLILTKIFRSKLLTGRLQIPFPTSWDYFFDKREPIFVLVHLIDGKMVGGYFGTDSYATSFPNHGDIYLQAVFKVNDDGTFDKPIDDTKGLLITKEQYSYLEIFNVPQQQ